MSTLRKVAGTIFGSPQQWSAAGTVSKRHYIRCVDPCPNKKYMNIKCKVALLTGAKGGIGLEIADSLLLCGLQKAIITDVHVPDGVAAQEYLIKKHGQGRAEFMQLDVLNHKQFEDVFRKVVIKDGGVDILVNNAGMLEDSKWEKTIDVNVKGVIKGAQLANKYMPKQKNKGGCVLNVASILGFDAFPFAPAYTGSKFAIIGLTKSFGVEDMYRKTGVRHIALCPGVTVTDLTDMSGNHKFLDDEYASIGRTIFNKLPVQKVPAVGKGAVYMVQYGPPGSMWTVESTMLARVHPPDRHVYKKKVMDL